MHSLLEVRIHFFNQTRAVVMHDSHSFQLRRWDTEELRIILDWISACGPVA